MFRAKEKKDKMSKASNFTDLIQRVAASCLLHPLGAVRHESVGNVAGDEEEEVYEYESDEEEAEEREEEKEAAKKNNGEKYYGIWESTKEMEMETMMNQVFDVVSAMKKAYLSLQEAHCPWDPEKMRVADAAVLSELRKLGVLRERFKRSCGGGRGRGGGASAATLREVVAPYEAAVEELKREVKAKELEVENLKEKLKSVASLNGNGTGKKGRSLSRRKVSCSQAQGIAFPQLSSIAFVLLFARNDCYNLTIRMDFRFPIFNHSLNFCSLTWKVMVGEK